MNVLSIDTSDNKEITVGIKIGEEKFVLNQKVDHRRAQAVLPMVEKLLKEHGLELKDLTEIEVNPGPGSFTGVRVGVAIANTLGFLLQIPVNGKKVGEMVEPVYD